MTLPAICSTDPTTELIWPLSWEGSFEVDIVVKVV